MALPEKNKETTIVASRFDDNGRSQVQNALVFGQNMDTLDNNYVTFIFSQIIEAINSLRTLKMTFVKIVRFIALVMISKMDNFWTYTSL